MASWFKTKREANTELKKRKAASVISVDLVWKWSHTKRKKPFFVGSYLEWLNI